MKRYTIPNFPVDHNFYDQMEYARSARTAICKALENDYDFDEFWGVVDGTGMGGGYFVDFENDEYHLHGITYVVFLYPPSKDFATLADVINSDLWGGTSVADEEAAWIKNVENFAAEDVECRYIFDDREDAMEWLETEKDDTDD